MEEHFDIRPVRILSPEWFNRNVGRSLTAEVLGGTLVVDGEPFEFVGDAPPDKRVMRVFLRQRFQAEPLESYHQRILQRQSIRDEERIRKRAVSIQRRGFAHTHNTKLNIPVAWSTASKPVLSGLLRKSNGDGLNRSSVVHVMVEEDLVSGRLKRKKGSILCNAHGSFEPSAIRHSDMDGVEYMPAVTCRQCLARAERWANKEDEQQVPSSFRYQSSSP